MRFERSRFESGAFAGTHLSGVEILDLTFSGVSLDLSNFDHVRFTRSAGPAGSTGWTAAAIVRGVVVNRGHALPRPALAAGHNTLNGCLWETSRSNRR